MGWGWGWLQPITMSAAWQNLLVIKERIDIGHDMAIYPAIDICHVPRHAAWQLQPFHILNCLTFYMIMDCIKKVFKIFNWFSHCTTIKDGTKTRIFFHKRGKTFEPVLPVWMEHVWTNRRTGDIDMWRCFFQNQCKLKDFSHKKC